MQDFFLRPAALGGRGWKKGGYHILIEADGSSHRMYPDEQTTNGVLQYKDADGVVFSNTNTVHINWIGGIDGKGNPIDNRTEAQKKELEKIVKSYIDAYPSIRILGHNQIAQKACPCFSVPKWSKSIGISEKNIYFRDNLNVLSYLKY